MSEAADAARRKAAKGASSVALSRLGNVIEVVSQPAYTWMFGLATYGLYQVLWSLVNIAENIFDLGVTSGLQRILPRQETIEDKARAVRAALLLGLLPNVAVAAIAFLAAPSIAAHLNVAAQDQGRLVTAVRVFVFALPLWAVIEVSTSAVRASHAFGPEVRLRLMWEQVARLIAAAVMWAAGVHTLGLLIAHLVSLSITAAAALRLLNRYVPLRDIIAVRAGKAMTRDMLLSGLSVLPANILGRVFSDVATVAANLLAPGAAGAKASAIYAIARKVASIPQIVRQTFGYVLGPIAAAQKRGDKATIQALYDFSVRLSLLLAVPTCAALIAAGPALLGLFSKGAEAGLPILAILTIARGIEATVGPAPSIQQVIGRRFLPLLNSLIAVMAAAGVLLLFVRVAPGIAIALGVATGQVVVVVLSIGQLAREEGLHAFRWPFPITFGVAIAASALLIAVGFLTRGAPYWVQGVAVLIAWAAALWTTIRLGLPREDKLALGKLGRTLRFV
ncbi:O-antigen/teichoic acid export membrane protein [Sphingomonas vulcanisoli]|uniref:O-antigen/teichoic acid export membrane protein n=1 Tax=Sphingomonas vulcanisoli TaxID=1658060 RepID=A0ABX0TT01_9SPHN|nr:O-antigen/teichoic acid export membrane protein [Sphingomonas vulcanisoli]